MLTLHGDGFAAAGELASLAASPDVHSFVALSPEEVARAGELGARYRQALTELYRQRAWKPPHVDPAAASARQALWTGVRTLLGPERAERLRRLSWRLLDGDAL